MPSAPFPSDLIGPNRAAEILHVNRITIRRMIERGQLAGYRVTPGLTKVSEAEVRAQIEVTAPTDLDAYVRWIVDGARRLPPEKLDKVRALLAPSA